jgi:hypothetical protein
MFDNKTKQSENHSFCYPKIPKYIYKRHEKSTSYTKCQLVHTKFQLVQRMNTDEMNNPQQSLTHSITEIIM